MQLQANYTDIWNQANVTIESNGSYPDAGWTLFEQANELQQQIKKLYNKIIAPHYKVHWYMTLN